MSTSRPIVMILGGSGVFGSRLTKELAKLKLFEILIAGRSKDNAAPILTELKIIDPESNSRFCRLDRDTLCADDLKNHKIFAIVDAAGPFQGDTYHVLEAALTAGCHYIDLSDARNHVAGFEAYDERAREANITAICGASSTPALSHAVLDQLTENWNSIDSILVAILPGNKTQRGKSVFKAILSWTGKSVKVFEGGEWRKERGWSNNNPVNLGPLGWRASCLAETPDLDQLVKRYNPHTSARFHAGLETGILHHGMRFLSWLRASHLLPDLQKLTPVLYPLAGLFRFCGTDAGGMKVIASGQDANNKPVSANWTLLAYNGQGPIVPGLAAVALLKKLAEKKLTFKGAQVAAGLLALEDFDPLIKDLDIEICTHTNQFPSPLFEEVVGKTAFSTMPEAQQKIHRGSPGIHATGTVNIAQPDNFLGHIISWVFRFPKPGNNVTVTVDIQRGNNCEYWQRNYPQRAMCSTMINADPANSTLEEKFGICAFRMKISAHEKGLDMDMQSARIWKIPLPKFLVPKITATERSNNKKQHLLNVIIELPVIGRIVHYQGVLDVE